MTRTTTRQRQPAGGRSGPVQETRVDPRVMAEARRVRRPGERMVIVSATTVRLVPDR